METKLNQKNTVKQMGGGGGVKIQHYNPIWAFC